MPTKQVVELVALGGDAEPLATFRLDGDTVTPDYHDADYREEVEVDGITMVVDGALRGMHPSDGRAFFDGLDAAYARSTLRRVVEVVEP